jgi:hypothetical protein
MKIKIPRTDEDSDIESEEGTKLAFVADMNELAYTELILSIGDKSRWESGI